MRNLRDKVVVITGAASGIGEALARGLCAKGARLALVDIDESRLPEIATELERVGAACEQSCGRRPGSAANAGLARRGRGRARRHVDVLINNAGVSVGAMFADHSIDDAEWLLQINLMGVIYGCKFFLPELLKAERAHIVNLSSMFGIFAMPGQAIYSTSKAGVRAFTEALWTELDGTSVRLTSVHPGGIRTDVIRSARGMNARDKARAMELLERFGVPAEHGPRRRSSGPSSATGVGS